MSPIIKPATTYDQQIELLEKRGLLIENKEHARDVLSRLNYYTFTGYLHAFKIDMDNYVIGLTFERISKIVEFDRRFRNILVYAIETIENTIKTKIAYNFAHTIGALEYLDEKHFKSKREHEIFIDLFNRNKLNNKNLPFVKHHDIAYSGKLPIWVAVELFTMGMIFNFFNNIPTRIQKDIAREYSTGPLQLSSWLENIKYLRNMIAHYMRLYNFKLQKTPMKCKKNHVFRETTYKVFDVVYIMKFLFLDYEEWNNYIVSSLNTLFSEYDKFIDLKCLGFPEDWKEILNKKK